MRTRERSSLECEFHAAVHRACVCFCASSLASSLASRAAAAAVVALDDRLPLPHDLVAVDGKRIPGMER